MPPNVMVIEDETDILTYLMTVLEDNGFTAHTISHRDAIMREVAEVKPDLILLDLMMPGQSGITVYKALRASRELSAIPVLIISGFSSNGGRMSADFDDMVTDDSVPAPDGFIDKPVDREELIAKARCLTTTGKVSSNG